MRNTESHSIVKMEIHSLFTTSTASKCTMIKAVMDCIYYHDTATSNVSFSHVIEETKKKEVTLIEMVAENKDGFTQCQIAGAKNAHDAYRLLGFPSMQDFKSMVRDNMIRNCPMTESDINTAPKIYGLDVASLKGKTVRRANGLHICDMCLRVFLMKISTLF